MLSAHTILIADDDHDLVDALSRRCRALGLSVRTVDNSLDLLNSMHREPPSLACVDVQMPSGTGLSACEMLAADPELAHIPIIIMTGKSDSATVRRCWQLNAYYVLKCTETWSRLEPIIRELLRLPAGEPLPGVAAPCDVARDLTQAGA